MTKIEIDNFYVGRCEEVMKGIDSESIDMVLTSPPYADQRSYGIKNSKIKPDGYVEWFKPMAHQIYRVVLFLTLMIKLLMDFSIYMF